jgi:hypothetical protein
MLKVNRQRTPSVGKGSTLHLARWSKNLFILKAFSDSDIVYFGTGLSENIKLICTHYEKQGRKLI